jgi:hypothetical protein
MKNRICAPRSAIWFALGLLATVMATIVVVEFPEIRRYLKFETM